MPESSRWLITQNRIEEAKSELKRAARFNKIQLDDGVWQQELVNARMLMILANSTLTGSTGESRKCHCH